MHEQYHLRCKSHHMSCQTWSPATSPDNPPSHILVTIQHSDSVVFHTFISRLVSSRHLSRAVVDEAHIVLTHDMFRAVMKTLRWLGSIACQILLLSATVGPSLVDDLFEAFGITHYIVLREPTNRPNLSFNVTHSSTPHQTLDYMVHDILSQPAPHKAIIFCRSREVAELIAGRLGVPFCHGRMTPPEINSVLSQLRMGIVRLIVSTSVLGVALDVMDLKWVIHFDYPYDIISYIQETGRAGQLTGTPAFSHVIIPQNSTVRYPVPDRFGAKLVYDWANNTQLCCRWLMQLFNDGVAEPCSMMRGVSHLCDICNVARLHPPERGALDPHTHDLILPYIPVKPSQ